LSGDESFNHLIIYWRPRVSAVAKKMELWSAFAKGRPFPFLLLATGRIAVDGDDRT
jgi:hypothetical protein